MEKTMIKRVGKKEGIVWKYDEDADVLYVSFGKPKESLSIDLGSGILVRYSEKSGEINGFTIIGLKRILNQSL
jgi:uncharacterized protein YuzE